MRRLRHDGHMELQTDRLLLREYTPHGRRPQPVFSVAPARLNVGADHPYFR
jgi:hypothetical protein